jgi:hypothetical protein
LTFTSGFALVKASMAGSRDASTQTVMALSASCSAAANPSSEVSQPFAGPDQAVRATSANAEVAMAALRANRERRRCCDAISVPCLVDDVDDEPQSAAPQAIRSYM